SRPKQPHRKAKMRCDTHEISPSPSKTFLGWPIIPIWRLFDSESVDAYRAIAILRSEIRVHEREGAVGLIHLRPMPGLADDMHFGMGQQPQHQDRALQRRVRIVGSPMNETPVLDARKLGID